MATKLGDALLYLGADDDKLKKDLGDAENKTKGWGATMTGLLQGIGQGAVGAIGGLISGAWSTFTESIDLASNLNETVSKVRTIFGDASVAIEQWASGAAKNLGMTNEAALAAVGTLGNMFQQLGMAGPEAAATSQQLVQLATDLGSFHNADPTEVLDNISSALRGEYDALQKYVPMINAAAVEQQALADTGKASAKELTDLEKSTAAIEIIMGGAGAAVGDFARTSDGWANTMKTLNAYWTEFKTLLGETLLPVLTPILDKVKDLANEWLPRLADYIRTSVIPAIEAWGAQFDSWWATHAQPFIDDAQQMWEDFVAQVETAMGDTDEAFGVNMRSLKATAQVLGGEIGDALGYAIGDGMKRWWSESFEGWWHDRVRDLILNSPLGSLLGLGTLGSTPTPQALPVPSMGPGAGISAQMLPQAITINNYVDAQTRSVAEASRDGTLEGLRQAGMR